MPRALPWMVQMGKPTMLGCRHLVLVLVLVPARVQVLMLMRTLTLR